MSELNVCDVCNKETVACLVLCPDCNNPNPVDGKLLRMCYEQGKKVGLLEGKKQGVLEELKRIIKVEKELRKQNKLAGESVGGLTKYGVAVDEERERFICRLENRIKELEEVMKKRKVLK